jgi:hypothetical protein
MVPMLSRSVTEAHYSIYGMGEEIGRQNDTGIVLIISAIFLACVAILWGLYGLSLLRSRRQPGKKDEDGS